MPKPNALQLRDNTYPKWDGNTLFEKMVLRDLGYPEDYHPTEAEAYRLIAAWLEDEE